MSRLLLILGAAALIVAVLVYPVAAIVAGSAVEAYLIAAKDKSAIDVERAIFEPPKGASKDSKAYRDAVDVDLWKPDGRPHESRFSFPRRSS